MQPKQQKIDAFDINGIGQANGHLFGLPFGFEDAEVVILPKCLGSDCFPDPELPVHQRPFSKLLIRWTCMMLTCLMPGKEGLYAVRIARVGKDPSRQLRVKAAEHIRLMESGHADGSGQTVEEVNDASNRLRKWVFEQCSEVLEQGKLPALLGGDHSTPLGLMQAPVFKISVIRHLTD